MKLESANKISLAIFSRSIKIKVKGGNIEIMYNVVPYKLKVMNAEDDILNLSPTRQIRNDYYREDNKCGDNFSLVV